MLLLMLLNALFAATYPLAQQALLYGPITLVIALRMLIAAALFLGIDLLFIKTSRPFRLNDWIQSLFIGIGALYIPFIFECWALERVSAIQVNGIYLLNPLICAVIEYYYAHHILNSRKLLALAMSLFGGILFIHHQGASFSVFPTYIELKALGALIISMILTAYTWFWVKKMLVKGHRLIRINGITMFISGILSLCTFIAIHNIEKTNSVASWHLVSFYSTLLALLGNIAGFSLFGILIQRYSLTLIALAQFTAPLFGILYEYLFFGTMISPSEALSLFVIMIGVALFYSQEQTIKPLAAPPVG